MTAQSADSLIYEGKQCILFANPLWSYFEQNPPRPNFCAQSSANWRGYVASWVINDSHLYLVGLSGMICARLPEEGGRQSSWCPVGHFGDCDFKDVKLDDFFDTENGMVFADWVTDELRVPQGKMVEYIHMGYGSKYERNLMIKIEGGEVTNTRIIGPEEYGKELEAIWGKKRKAEKRRWQLWK